MEKNASEYCKLIYMIFHIFQLRSKIQLTYHSHIHGNRTESCCDRQSAKTAGHAQYESRIHPLSLPPFYFQNGGRRIKNEHVIGNATGPPIFPLCFCALVKNKCYHSMTCCGCLCRNRQNDPYRNQLLIVANFWTKIIVLCFVSGKVFAL